MPRGKYDRKESRIKRLEASVAERDKALKSAKSELERTLIELKAARKVIEATEDAKRASQSPMSAASTERFTILRDNLTSLSNTRKLLVDNDQMDEQVLSAIDGEIQEHLRLMAVMREETFVEEQKKVKKVARQQPSPQQVTVPLPSNIPPSFQSIRTR